MLRIIIITFILCSVNAKTLAQNEKDMLVVTYLTTYKHKKSMSEPWQEYTRLRVIGNKSFFQSYNEMHTDSIRMTDANNQEKLSRYNSHLKFSIEFLNDSLVYNEVLIKDEFQYSEKINLKWKTDYADQKDIKGYECSKATTSYGGRDWTVWYSKDLPYNAGPYKFKGLPGLILKASDHTSSYIFELYQIDNKKVDTSISLSRLYHKHTPENRVITSRSAFNKINTKIKNFSKQETMNAIFTDDNGQSTGTMVVYQPGAEPSNSLRTQKRDVSKDDANLIEISKI